MIEVPLLACLRRNWRLLYGMADQLLEQATCAVASSGFQYQYELRTGNRQKDRVNLPFDKLIYPAGVTVAVGSSRHRAAAARSCSFRPHIGLSDRLLASIGQAE